MQLLKSSNLKKNTLCKNIKINIHTRKLMRLLMTTKKACSPTQALSKPLISSREMSVSSTYKYKNAAAAFAPDDGKGHTAKTVLKCNNVDCENKTCKYPCSSEDYTLIAEGHFTHKPSKNKKGILLDTTDIEGKSKDQFYVKNNNENVKITGNDFKNMTEEDLQPQQKADAYSKLQHIESIIKNAK